MAEKPTGGLTELTEMIKTDSKVRNGVIGAALAVVLILLIVICVSCSGKEDESGAVSDNAAAAEDSGDSDVSADAETDTLTETTDEAILNLVTTYYQALQDGDSATIETIKSDVSDEEKIKLETKAQDIESINNIKVYTRPGMSDGAYIAYIYSEIKFAGIDTVAPGLTTIYLSAGSDGSLYIDGSVDDEVMEYVKEVSAQQVIADFFSQVSADYTNALEADEQLKTYMSGLNQKLEDAVAAKAQEAEQAESEETQEAVSTAVNETVTTTTKVNVRASDSENADRIGQVESGTSLTRYETKDNGWSKIDYNGQEGYIKSEYLQAAESADTSAEETTEATDDGETQEEQTTETTEATETTGTVTIKEAVRVRASASTDGEYLGSAYQGETYDLIMEQADGWCKISYNGQTAYVKTEFVEIN